MRIRKAIPVQLEKGQMIKIMVRGKQMRKEWWLLEFGPTHPLQCLHKALTVANFLNNIMLDNLIGSAQCILKLVYNEAEGRGDTSLVIWQQIPTCILRDSRVAGTNCGWDLNGFFNHALRRGYGCFFPFKLLSSISSCLCGILSESLQYCSF